MVAGTRFVHLRKFADIGVFLSMSVRASATLAFTLDTSKERRSMRESGLFWRFPKPRPDDPIWPWNIELNSTMAWAWFRASKGDQRLEAVREEAEFASVMIEGSLEESSW